MRKVIKNISLIIMLCLLCILLNASSLNQANAGGVGFCKECGQENCICSIDIPSIEELDSNTILEIKQDYKEYLSHNESITVDIDDISIIGYYGTYGGHYNLTSIAIKFEVRNIQYLEVKHELLISYNNKTRFIYPNSNAIMIWCIPHITNLTEWNIHGMKAAFKHGFLTSSEVITIGALHEAESSDYYKNNRFDLAKENQIKRDYYYTYEMDKTWSYGGVTYRYTYDDVYILAYCGEYSSGAVSLMMTGSGMAYSQALTSETVDGLTFHYSDSNQLKVWHEGKFYKLSDAYSLGLITYEELLVTYALYYAQYSVGVE